MQAAICGRSVPGKSKAIAHESDGSDPADVVGLVHRADKAVGASLFENGDVVFDLVVSCPASNVDRKTKAFASHRAGRVGRTW